MQTNFIATWRPDAQDIYKNADAQKVAEEIYALGDKPTVHEILEMARNENTEIHKLIEWDDKIAAEKYRIVRIRHIVRDIQITHICTGKKKKEKIEVPLRMYHNLKGEAGYRPVPKIIQDEDLHKKLLMTARAELDAFRRKYSILSELKPLLEEIDKIIYELKIFDEAG